MDDLLINPAALRDAPIAILDGAIAAFLFAQRPSLLPTRMLAWWFASLSALAAFAFLTCVVDIPRPSFLLNRVGESCMVIASVVPLIRFAYAFLEDDRSALRRLREARIATGLAAIGAVALWAYFVIDSLAIHDVAYAFEIQHYESAEQSRFGGPGMTAFVIAGYSWALLVLLRKSFALAVFDVKKARSARRFALIVIAAIFATVLHRLESDDSIPIGSYTTFTLPTTLAAAALYVSSTRATAGLRGKLVGVGLAALLAAVGLIASLAMNVAEKSYLRTQAALAAQVRALVDDGANVAGPHDLMFVARRAPTFRVLAAQGVSPSAIEALAGGEAQPASSAAPAFWGARGDPAARAVVFDAGGDVLVGFSYRAYREFLHEGASVLLLVMLCSTLVLLLVLPLLFRASVFTPLQGLLAGVRRVDEGKLEVDVEVRFDDEIGAVTRSFNGMMRAISDRERRLEAAFALIAEKEASEASARARAQFVAHVSHELRTPLHVILGNAELLEAEGELQSAARARLAVLHGAGEHLLSIIDDILDLSKVDAGKLVIEPAEVDLHTTIGALVEALGSTAQAKGTTLQARFGASAPRRVRLDPKLLRQVLLNLVGNAVKFTARGSVVVHVERGDGDVVRFLVEDSGPGVSTSERERIFEPFQQGAAGNASGGGTGLGLPIARRLARALGGDVVVSDRPGGGAVFAFDVTAPAVDTDVAAVLTMAEEVAARPALPALAAAVPPSAAVVDELLGLAADGDFAQLRSRLDALSHEDPRCAPFVEQLASLTARYRIGAVRELLRATRGSDA